MSDTPLLEIGVICAIDQEFAALRDAFGLEAASNPGEPFDVVTGRTAHCRLHLAQSGIGKANVAALAAYLLAREPQIGLMVFSGVAGGMNPALAPGDLVIARETATHDYGALRDGRHVWYRSGDLPFGPAPEPAYEPASHPLAALDAAIATFTGAAVSLGRVISGDLFLNCRDSRDRLQARWNADAVDMESATFAEVVRRFGRPMLILRTISDRACEESHLTFEQMANLAAANSAGFLAAFIAALERDPASVEAIRGYRS